MKTSVALLVATFVLMELTKTTFATVDCSNPTTSTQTGPLCQLAGTGTASDFPLSLVQLTDIGGFGSLVAQGMVLLGATANNVCDTDCRCFMGATVAGGTCATRNSDGQVFCMCNYNTTTAVTPLNPVLTAFCPVPLFGLICNLASSVCDSDCICSHGNPDNGGNTCTTNNGVSGNTATYCVCNGHQNYQ